MVARPVSALTGIERTDCRKRWIKNAGLREVREIDLAAEREKERGREEGKKKTVKIAVRLRGAPLNERRHTSLPIVSPFFDEFWIIVLGRK